MAVTAGVALLSITAITPAAQACSVCFGDPESPQTAGMNAAIGTLLGVTLVVLTGVAAFGGLVIRRFAQQAAADDLSEEERHG